MAYTSLLGNVVCPSGVWTDILSLTLDPGVWILLGDSVAELDTGGTFLLRFTDGATTFGSSQQGQYWHAQLPAPPATFVAPLHALGVADLSLALVPTTVKMQVYFDDLGLVNATHQVRAATEDQNSAGVTFFMAFVDAQAILNQILAAVQRTFPHQ
jgi:hypothetical protein